MVRRRVVGIDVKSVVMHGYTIFLLFIIIFGQLIESKKLYPALPAQKMRHSSPGYAALPFIRQDVNAWVNPRIMPPPPPPALEVNTPCEIVALNTNLHPFSSSRTVSKLTITALPHPSKQSPRYGQQLYIKNSICFVFWQLYHSFHYSPWNKFCLFILCVTPFVFSHFSSYFSSIIISYCGLQYRGVVMCTASLLFEKRLNLKSSKTIGILLRPHVRVTERLLRRRLIVLNYGHEFLSPKYDWTSTPTRSPVRYLCKCRGDIGLHGA
mgnify:CR=1 FL=1